MILKKSLSGFAFLALVASPLAHAKITIFSAQDALVHLLASTELSEKATITAPNQLEKVFIRTPTAASPGVAEFEIKLTYLTETPFGPRRCFIESTIKSEIFNPIAGITASRLAAPEVGALICQK